MRATTQTGAADSRCADRAAAARAPFQPGLRDGALRGLGAGRHGGALRATRSSRVDVVAFERAELERLGLPPGVGIEPPAVALPAPVLRAGYAAGYYVYLWAEVLDADGYEAFVEAGDPFDAGGRARASLRFIYSSGNSIEPGAAYRAFRGRAARPSRCCAQRGLLEPVAA